jgi:hypothetical protein
MTGGLKMSRKSSIVKFLVFTMILTLPFFVIAGTTGKLAGRVVDAENGNPIPGVNVYLQGTTLGGATDLDGNYYIINIPPGTYTLTASMIGYKETNKTKVLVKLDRTIKIDFELEIAIMEGEEITVVANREITSPDVSATKVIIEASEAIENAPVIDFTDFLNLQPGVEDLLIRGGTRDQTLMMVDGIMLVDERRNEPIMNVNLSAVQEVELMTGGFNAEYGNVRSGVINIITKTGQEKYGGSVDFRISPPTNKHFGDELYWTADWQRWSGTGSMEPSEDFIGWNAYADQLNNDGDPNNDITADGARRRWEWRHRQIEYGKEGPSDYMLDASFSGPVPFTDNTKFFLSYRRQYITSILPLYAITDTERLGQTLQTFQGKIIYKINPSMDLLISGMYSEDFWLRNFWSPVRGTLPLGHIPGNFGKYSYQHVPSNLYTGILGAKLTHGINPGTFYTVQLEYSRIKDFASPGPGRDTTKVFEYEPGKFLDETPWGQANLGHFTDAVGVYQWNGGPFLSDVSSITTWRLKVDLTSQIDLYNNIRTGIEFAYNDLREDMRYYDPAHTLQDTRLKWSRFPIRASVYLQDKFEWEGMIANAGVRVDYASANVDWYTGDPFHRYFSAEYKDSLSYLFTEASESRWNISPRLGVSHPISENVKIFFNYGHFYSMPVNQQYYGLQEGTSFNNRITMLGNPNLYLPRTVSYELGFETDLFDELLLNVVGYYKDVTDQAGELRFINRFGTVDYNTYQNKNYQDIRGFEIRLDKKYGRFWYGWLNYNYMEITNGYVGYRTIYEDPRIKPAKEGAEQFRPVAQPSLRASLEFHTPIDFGPDLAGFHLLGGWAINVIYTWQSGAYETFLPRGPDETNNVQWVDYSNMNLRIRKQIRKIFGTQPEFYISITNLFDQKYLNRWAFNDAEWLEYMNSLKLPMFEGDRNGNDRIGIYPEDGKNEHVNVDINPLKNWQLFLWPRDIYIGARIYF